MAAEYKVEKISERFNMSDRGALVKLYHVEAETAGGVRFTMDLSEDQARPAEAQKILKAKAAELDALLEL